MTSQKKVIISLSVVCALILIALITVVSVWAATSQTVTTTLTIRYSATNVSATVTADFMLEGDDDFTNIGTTTFQPKDTSESRALTKDGDINLTDAKTYALYKYTFTNNGSNTFNVTLTNNATASNNMAVTYATANTSTVPSTIDGSTAPSAVSVTGGSTVYIYIKVAVSSVASDATYTGTLSWNLASVTNAD